MNLDNNGFPAMQDNSALNLQGWMVQQALMRATGQPPSTFSPLTAAAGLARAVTQAETGDDWADPFTMPF